MPKENTFCHLTFISELFKKSNGASALIQGCKLLCENLGTNSHIIEKEDFNFLIRV